jgi:transketolase C-terminal domain/subunit
MINSSDRPPLRHISQGLAVGALLAGMATMAFAAGLALLGAMFVLPITVGFTRAWQFLRDITARQSNHRRCTGRSAGTIIHAPDRLTFPELLASDQSRICRHRANCGR